MALFFLLLLSLSLSYLFFFPFSWYFLPNWMRSCEHTQTHKPLSNQNIKMSVSPKPFKNSGYDNVILQCIFSSVTNRKCTHLRPRWSTCGLRSSLYVVVKPVLGSQCTNCRWNNLNSLFSDRTISFQTSDSDSCMVFFLQYHCWHCLSLDWQVTVTRASLSTWSVCAPAGSAVSQTHTVIFLQRPPG